MPDKKRKSGQDVDYNLSVDDQTLDELRTLEGQSISKIALWDETIIDALEDSALGATAVDMDVYLEHGVLFELYGVLCYPDLDDEPIANVAELSQLLTGLQGKESLLDGVAVDTEDDLVLVVLDAEDQPLYLNAGAWMLEEWEELPD